MLLLRMDAPGTGFHEAFAAGGVALETDQRAVIIFRDGQETLVLQAAHATPSAGLAWIIPVSSAPRPADVFLCNQEFIEAAFSETEPIRWRHITATYDTPNVSPAISGLMPLLYGIGAALRSPRGAPPIEPLGPGLAAAAPPPEEKKVTIHALLNLGPYRIAIISAREGAALTTWLDTHGFTTPQGLPELAEDYIARGWSFVAATTSPVGQPSPLLGPSVASPQTGAPRPPGAARTSLAYLPPLAINFATPQPVYPLKISRLGSPPLLCLRLVILAPEGVWLTTPPGSPIVQEDLPLAIEQMKTRQAQPQLAGLLARRNHAEPRVFLDSARREFAATTNYRVLICETRAPLEGLRRERTPARAYKVYTSPGTPTQRQLDEAPLAPGLRLDASKLYATRFWGLLRREALDDLIFQCGRTPASPNALWSGRPSQELFATREMATSYAVAPLLGGHWVLALPPVLVLLVLTILLAGPLQRSLFGKAGQQGAPPAPLPPQSGRRTTARAVFLFVVLPAAALYAMAVAQITLGVIVAASWPLWLLGPLVVPAVIWLECREPALAKGTVLALAVAAGAWLAALLAAPAVGLQGSRHATWAVLACASQLGLYSILAGLLTGAFTEPNRPIKAWPIAAYIAVLVGTVGTGLEARVAGYEPSHGFPPRDFQESRQQILSAISAFAFDNGALPRSLKDLTSTGPITEALDSSGNPVRLNLPGGRAPYLHKLPVDPLSGRRDTWTYDPVADLVVDSAAWGLVKVETIGLQPALAGH